MVRFSRVIFLYESISKDSKNADCMAHRNKKESAFYKKCFVRIKSSFSPSLPIPQLSLEFQMPEPVCTVSPFEIHGREIVSWPSKLLSALTFLSLTPLC